MALRKIEILPDLCKGCGYCVAFCPQTVFQASSALNARGHYPPSVARPDDCTGCGLCEMICPDFAVRRKNGKRP